MTMVRGVALWACVAVGLVGCCHHRYDDLTTRPGRQLKEAMFLGAWTLDGERTNAANGNPGDGAVPPDVLKGVLGSVWRFETDSLLRTDLPAGWKTGSWRLVGRNTLVVNEGNGELQYSARFDVGHLCLKKSDGTTLILERSKAGGD